MADELTSPLFDLLDDEQKKKLLDTYHESQRTAAVRSVDAKSAARLAKEAELSEVFSKQAAQDAVDAASKGGKRAADSAEVLAKLLPTEVPSLPSAGRQADLVEAFGKINDVGAQFDSKLANKAAKESAEVFAKGAAKGGALGAGKLLAKFAGPAGVAIGVADTLKSGYDYMADTQGAESGVTPWSAEVERRMAAEKDQAGKDSKAYVDSIPNSTLLPDYLRGMGSEEEQPSPVSILASIGQQSRSPAAAGKPSVGSPSLAPAGATPAPSPSPDQVKALISNLYGEGLGDEDLKAAMGVRDDKKLSAMLSGLGDNLAADMSRGTRKKDTSFYDALTKDADQGVKDIHTRREGKDKELTRESGMLKIGKEKALMDPTSKESKARRELYANSLKGTGVDKLPGWEGMSAYDLDSSKSILEMAEKALQRKHDLAMKQEETRAAKEQKILDKLPEEEAKLRKELTQGKLTSKAYATFDETDNFYRALQEYQKNPNGFQSLALQYGFIKSNDPESAVREGELALSRSIGSVPNRVRKSFLRAVTGAELTAEDTKDLMSLAKTRRDESLSRYKRIREPIVQAAAERGMNMGRIDPLNDYFDGSSDSVTTEISPEISSGAAKALAERRKKAK